MQSVIHKFSYEPFLLFTKCSQSPQSHGQINLCYWKSEAKSIEVKIVFLQIYLCGTTTIEPAGQEFPCLNGNRSKFKLSIQDIPNSINVRHIGLFFIIYWYFPIPFKKNKQTTENRTEFNITTFLRSLQKLIRGRCSATKMLRKHD